MRDALEAVAHGWPLILTRGACCGKRHRNRAAERGGSRVSILLQPAFHQVLTAVAAATPAATATSASTLAPATGSSGGSSNNLGSLGGLLFVVVFFFAAFVVIFMVALVFWTWRDVRSRTQDTVMQITATLLVLVFNLGGLFIYLIV